MLKIGLTGGIGCGKSIVANYFAELGINIIDTDVIAREVVMPGSDILQQITTHFGQDILHSSGELNRQQLRTRIFTNDQERVWLGQLLHPAIWQEVKHRIRFSKTSYSIIVVPLLIESKLYKEIDRVLVVDCSEQIQIKRVLQRDAFSTREQIDKIIKTQVDRKQRLQFADDIITNDGDLTALKQQIEMCHQNYMLLAAKQKPIADIN